MAKRQFSAGWKSTLPSTKACTDGIDASIIFAVGSVPAHIDMFVPAPKLQVGLVVVERLFLEHSQRLEEDWTAHELKFMQGGGIDC